MQYEAVSQFKNCLFQQDIFEAASYLRKMKILSFAI